MRKHQAIFIIILCLLTLISMVALDIHLVFSDTNTHHQINKYTLGIEATEAAPQAANLHFFVDGSNVFSNRLRKELFESLSSNPAFQGETKIIEEKVQTLEHPILIVEIQSKRLLWTPLYAQTELSVNFGYASTGDITWKDDDREVVEMQESPSALVDGEITIQDKSYGLMTWKGYQNLLAKAAAHQINVSLARQLTSNPAWEPRKD